MASSAVRSYLDSFLARGSKFPLSKLDDLVIIVGKGLRSFEEPVLLPTLRGVLSQEYGIDGKVDTENRGRIVIAAETLRALIVDRSWKWFYSSSVIFLKEFLIGSLVAPVAGRSDGTETELLKFAAKAKELLNGIGIQYTTVPAISE